MTFSHGLKFKMTHKISLSTNICTCNKWHENLYVFHWCDYYLTLRIKYCLQANGQMVLTALSLFQRITTHVDLVGSPRGLHEWGSAVTENAVDLYIFKNSFLDIWVDIPLTNFIVPGVLISTDDRRNVSATLFKEVGYFFPQRRSN